MKKNSPTITVVLWILTVIALVFVAIYSYDIVKPDSFGRVIINAILRDGTVLGGDKGSVIFWVE